MERAALATLQDSRDLLVPHDATTERLVHVKPIYATILTLADPAGDLRLRIDWQEANDADSSTPAFEVVFNKWTRLERDSSSASPLLDISLSDLDTGQAWQFDVQAAQAVDESRLPKALSDFAHSVKIDPRAAHSYSTGGDKLFVLFRSHAVNLKSIQQRMSYRYGLASSDYTLELFRFQDRTYPPRKATLIASSGGPAVYEPRWSLNVYRVAWDTMFAINERLAVGEAADWKDDAETWFPKHFGADDEKPDAGFGQLMEELKRIEKVVGSAESAEVGDLMDGMTIG